MSRWGPPVCLASASAGGEAVGSTRASFPWNPTYGRGQWFGPGRRSLKQSWFWFVCLFSVVWLSSHFSFLLNKGWPKSIGKPLLYKKDASDDGLLPFTSHVKSSKNTGCNPVLNLGLPPLVEAFTIEDWKEKLFTELGPYIKTGKFCETLTMLRGIRRDSMSLPIHLLPAKHPCIRLIYKCAAYLFCKSLWLCFRHCLVGPFPPSLSA